MGLGQKFLTRVRSDNGLGLNLKNVKFFNFFTLGQKKLLRVGSESTWVEAGSASYLLRVKSKLGSGRVGSGPIFSKLSILF